MDPNPAGTSQNGSHPPPSSVPITFGGIPMGTLPAGSGQSSLQFLMIRPEPASSSSSSAEHIAKTLPRILPATARPLVNIASNTSSVPGSSSERTYKKFDSIFAAPQNFSASTSEPVLAYFGTPNPDNRSAPGPIFQSLIKSPPMNNFLVTISPQTPTDQAVPRKRGRKRMTDEEKAAAKKQRDRVKNQDFTGSGKPGKRRRRKRGGKNNQMNQAADYEKEFKEMREKVASRFDSKKKPTIRKQDVGYFGPYIKFYTFPANSESAVPMPNYIVDDLETHLGNPSGPPKSKYHLEKNIGVIPQEPFVCYFCHFDPSAERETAAGDLIGPIVLSGRMNGETKQSAYFHEKCLEWSSNFRMVGFEIVDLVGLLNDAKTLCSFCGRKGATIGCSAPLNCTKAFHYPCATLSDCRMVTASHQVYCEEHNCDRSPTREVRTSPEAEIPI